jgi:hypothetical protein
MLPDRLIGILCLGVAAFTATWGGDASLRAHPLRGTLNARQLGSTSPPASEATTTTAAATSTTVAPSTTTSAAPSTTTTAPAPALSPEEAKAMARQGAVVIADLPAGFSGSVKAAPADAPAATDGPFDRCLGPDAGALTAAIGARARSGQFARAGSGTVASSSAVFDQRASTEKVMGILDSPAARSCFEGIINARLARNPKLPENVRGSLTPIDLGPAGDRATAFRFEVRLPAEEVEQDPPPGEKDVPYLTDFVFVRRGRVLALVEFANLRQPFPAGDAKAVLASLAGHMPAT